MIAMRCWLKSSRKDAFFIETFTENDIGRWFADKKMSILKKV